MSKCIVKNGFITPCENLNDRLDFAQYHSKGFIKYELRNKKTHERTRDLISYKKNSKDDGLCINFCPFCGVNLTGLYLEEGDE